MRALIAGAVQAAEAGDAAGVRAAISPNYSDAEGRDRQTLDGVIRLSLVRHRPLHLYARIPTVEVIGNDRATAVVYAAMAGSKVDAPADVARLSASLYRFDLTLELERGEWRVRSAAWRPAELSEIR